jgi:hypothetical protein
MAGRRMSKAFKNHFYKFYVLAINSVRTFKARHEARGAVYSERYIPIKLLPLFNTPAYTSP